MGSVYPPTCPYSEFSIIFCNATAIVKMATTALHWKVRLPLMKMATISHCSQLTLSQADIRKIGHLLSSGARKLYQKF